VLAVTNGAGKSSIAGAMLIEEGVEYFNPDEAAELIRVANPGITLDEAQSAAWDEGRRLLERAINERLNYPLDHARRRQELRSASGMSVSLTSNCTLRVCVRVPRRAATTFLKKEFVSDTHGASSI
jgi:hypothetical protein